MAKAENINPRILAWARESAGLSIEEAADRLGFRSGEKRSAAEKLAEIEAGNQYPTKNQLMKFAAVYRRPLLSFYMDEPPRRGERGEDFRTLDVHVSPRDNALLDALLRDIRARQEMVKSILEDEDDARPLPFVGSMSQTDGVEAVANSIGGALNLPADARLRPGRNSGADELFRELRHRAERAGIFVLLVGDLGSHHSAISETVFRGFAIADSLAPFVVINDQDAKSARSFTMIHELAHIWLGQSGVSGAADKIEARTEAGRVEQFCNDVAGEFLLPQSALNAFERIPADAPPAEIHRAITHIAQVWSVSEPMVAYRLNRMGWISRTAYRQLASDYAARWMSIKQRTKEKNKESEGGPSYYVVKQHKLGNALIDVVRRTLRENILSHTKAAKVLGVKPSSVEPLIRNLEKSRGAIIPDMGR